MESFRHICLHLFTRVQERAPRSCLILSLGGHELLLTGAQARACATTKPGRFSSCCTSLRPGPHDEYRSGRSINGSVLPAEMGGWEPAQHTQIGAHTRSDLERGDGSARGIAACAGQRRRRGRDQDTSSHASTRPMSLGLRCQVCRAPVHVSMIAAFSDKSTSRVPAISQHKPC